MAISAARMAAESSSVVDLRNRGFYEEADEIERIVEEKIKKINNAVDKFYNGLSQMSPEETVELFVDVLTFPFTPEGLVYRGLGKATRSALRTTTRTVPTTTTRTAPTTTTRTVPMTTTRTVSKKTTGPTSNQPIRRSPRIAEKRKLAGTEQAGSGGKRFAVDTGKNIKWKIGENLYDGVKISIDEALVVAESFLGSGYKDMGKGRFVSSDGIRQVRMLDSDLAKINNHAGAPHMNFEFLESKAGRPGKMKIKRNYHVFLEE